jgi:hypothetical protein
MLFHVRIQHAKRIQIVVVAARSLTPNAAVIALGSIRHPHAQSRPHKQRCFAFLCMVLRQHIAQSAHVDGGTKLHLWNPAHLLQTTGVRSAPTLIRSRHKRTPRMCIFNILFAQLTRSHRIS